MLISPFFLYFVYVCVFLEMDVAMELYLNTAGKVRLQGSIIEVAGIKMTTKTIQTVCASKITSTPQTIL